MKRGFANRALALLKEPWMLPGFILVLVFDVLSKPGTKKRVQRRNEQFAAQIREEIPFLFGQYAAEIIPNDEPPPPFFDWAKVVLAVGDLRFMFTRDQGIIGVHVAPRYAPTEWQNLSALLTWIERQAETHHDTEYTRLPTIARLLEPRIPKIKEALSKEQFEKTKETLLSIDEEDAQRALSRLNADLDDRRKRLGIR